MITSEHRHLSPDDCESMRIGNLLFLVNTANNDVIVEATAGSMSMEESDGLFDRLEAVFGDRAGAVATDLLRLADSDSI